MSESVLTKLRSLAIGDCPIAVVGMGCRFPAGINSAERLYASLMEGKSLVSEVPEARFGLKRFLHPVREVKGRSVTFKAGVAGDVSLFDASFFNLSRPEALSLDPQQRLVLEMSYEALNRAGLTPAALKGTDTAVVIGAASTDMALLRADDTPAVGPYAMTGTNLSIISNRLSYVYDLHGPSLTVDTACSSSLVALHTACEYLRSGKAGMALAGGVNILLSPLPFIGFSQAHMLSKEGRCAVFCENADGYVRAEGGAVLILKRLKDALLDGNSIVAVIAATGVNSDGATRGIALPSEKAQQTLLESVYQGAGLSPARLVYLEAHGTGTKAGDPVETEAIGRALATQIKGRALNVGSVKAITGHLETASGMAGMAKAMEILRTGKIPPQKLYGPLNSAIDFKGLNLSVNTEAQALPQVEGVGLAGVNSFGFGGTNAHVVLADVNAVLKSLTLRKRAGGFAALNGTPPDKTETALNATCDATLPNLKSNTLPRLNLSARSLASLKALSQETGAFINDGNAEAVIGGLNLRESFNVSLSVRARRAAGFKEALNAFAAMSLGTGERWPRLKATYYRLRESELVLSQDAPYGSLVLVYTGNGAQYAGMGKELYAENTAFRESVDEVARILRDLGAPDIVGQFALASDTQGESCKDALHSPVISQLSLFAIEVGLTRLVKESGFAPVAALGHSVGEVAAAWAAGRLSLEEAALVIYTRSRFQAQTSTEGGMAAVKMERTALEEILKGGAFSTVEIAGFNAPHSFTLSGRREELKALQSVVREHAGVMRLLDLSYAFHSAFMEPIRAQVLDSLRTLCAAKLPAAAEHTYSRKSGKAEAMVSVKAKSFLNAFSFERCSFISTVTGKEESVTDADYWWKNIRRPVRFEDAVETALKKGGTTFLEAGPRGILVTYVEECAKASGREISALSLTARNKAHSSDVESVLELTHALTGVKEGAQESLSSLSDEARALLPFLPTYAFDRVPCWLQSSPECSGIFKYGSDPLLGIADPSLRTSAGAARYVSYVDGTLVPALSSHEVNGECLFPFTGFLNNALSLARMQQGKHNALCLLNFELRRALPVMSLTRLESSIDVHGEVEIYARPYLSEGRSELCARGRVLPVDAGEERLETLELRKNFTEELDAGDFYARLKSLGFNYGTPFRSIEKIALKAGSGNAASQGREDADAVLVTARYAPDVTGALLSLGGMDAALQAVFALMLTRFKERALPLYLPVSVEHLTLLRLPVSGTLTLLLNHFKPAQGQFSFDVTVADAEGRVLLKGSKVRFKALPEGERPAFYAEKTRLLLSFRELKESLACKVRAEAVKDAQDPARESLSPESQAVLPNAVAFSSLMDRRERQGFDAQPAGAGLSQSPAHADHRVRALRQAALCAFILSAAARDVPVGEPLSPEEIFGTLLYGQELTLARHALNLLVKAGMAERAGEELYCLKDNSVLGLKGERLFAELMERDRIHSALYLPFRGRTFTLKASESAVEPSGSPKTSRKALSVAESLLRSLLRSEEGAFALQTFTRKLKLSLGTEDGERALNAMDGRDGRREESEGSSAASQQFRVALMGDPTLLTLTGLKDSLKSGVIELTLIEPSEEGASELLKERLGVLHLEGVRTVRAQALQDGESCALDPCRYDALMAGPLPLPSEREVLPVLTAALKEETPVLTLNLAPEPLITLQYAQSLVSEESLPAFLDPEELFTGALKMSAALTGLPAKVPLRSDSGSLFTLAGFTRSALPQTLQREVSDADSALSDSGALLSLPAFLKEEGRDAATLTHEDAECLQERLVTAFKALSVRADKDVPLLLDLRLYTVREPAALSALTRLAAILMSAVAALHSKKSVWLLPSGTEGEPLGSSLRAALRTASRELSLNALACVACASSEKVPDPLLAAALRIAVVPRLNQGESAEYRLDEAGLSLSTVRRESAPPEAALTAVTALQTASDKEEGSGKTTAYPVLEGGLHLECLKRGRLQSLAFVKGTLPYPDSSDPSDLRVLITVRAAGLNFRDVMWASGLLPPEALEQGFSGTGLGLECAGEILAAGGGALRLGLSAGQRVMALAPHALASQVVTLAHAVFPLPEGLSFAEGAALPVTFFTAAYALCEKARARKGESVLIHGAAGGVGLAALQIALSLGLTVHATAGNPRKRALLKALGAHYVYDSRSLGFVPGVLKNTEGKGVNVILNSLYDREGAWSFELTATGGTFIELGKRDFYEDHPLYLKHFKDNVTYCGVDADALVASFPELATRVMGEVAEGFRRGNYQPLPVSLYTASNVEEAFLDMRHARHVGKVVILAPETDARRVPGTGKPCVSAADPVAAAAGTDTFTIRRGGRGFSLQAALAVPDMTFVVTGGTGGVGRAVVKELIARGAGAVHVLARHVPEVNSGLPETAAGEGAFKTRPVYHAVDVSSEESVREWAQAFIRSLTREASLKSGCENGTAKTGKSASCPVTVLHLAGLTRDKAFNAVSVTDMEDVLKVKYAGAAELVRALKGKVSLHSFLALSSVTVLLGNPGQLAYVSANAALESLIPELREQGVAATAQGLGPVQDAGMLGGRERLLAAFKKQLGAPALKVCDVLTAVESLTPAAPATVYYFAADLRKLASLMGENRRFTGLCLGLERKSAAGEDDLRARLGILPEAEALKLLSSLMVTELSSLMGVEQSTVSVTRPLTALGVDSLLVMEFISALEERLSLKIPLSVASDEVSIQSLASALLKLIREGERATEADSTLSLLERQHGLKVNAEVIASLEGGARHG